MTQVDSPLSQVVVATADGICPIDTDDLCEICISLGELMSGKSLFKYQGQVAYRIFESVFLNGGDVITTEFSRQSGKSEVISVVCAVLMVLMPLLAINFPNDPRFVLRDPNTGRVMGYAQGFKIGVFGPKKEQADIIYKRVKEHFEKEASEALLVSLELAFEVSNGKNCKLSNGSLCSASTANEGASIEGDSYHLIVTDETQRIVDQMIKKSILPMGSSTNATVVHIGTASIGKCHFYSAIKTNKRNFALGGRRCHFEVSWKEAAAENAFYLKYVTTQKEKLGESSDEFQMSYCNKWLLERGQFIDEEGLHKILDPTRDRGDWDALADRINFKSRDLGIVAGIDFAKQHDRTVLTLGIVDYGSPVYEEEIRDLNEWKIISYFRMDVVEWHTFDGDDYETQYHALVGILSTLPYPLMRLCLDATGCGQAITDRFRATFQNIDVIPYTFTLQSKDSLYRNFQRMIKTGQISFPGSTESRKTRDSGFFEQEMLDLEKNYSNGYLVVKHPDEPGAHDDFPDSGALCAWCASARPENVEAECDDSNPFTR